MLASARLLDPTMPAADQYPLTVIPVIVGLAAFILKNGTLCAGGQLRRRSPAAVSPTGVWGACRLPQSPDIPRRGAVLRSQGARLSRGGPGPPAPRGSRGLRPERSSREGAPGGSVRAACGGRATPRDRHSGLDGGLLAKGLTGSRRRRSGPLWRAFPLPVRGCAFGRGPGSPAAPAGTPEGRPLPPPPAPCWQSPAGAAGAWGCGPRAAGSLQLLAPLKMTICHSIKVSGRLKGEPGSATPGQNGLLPRIGEVQMLNAEHRALSQARPPPGRRSGRWTAAG